jgi:hypothetical protein
MVGAKWLFLIYFGYRATRQKKFLSPPSSLVNWCVINCSGIQCASNLILRSLHRPPNLHPSIGEVRSRPSLFQLRRHRVPCHCLSIIISDSENSRPPLSFTPECEAGLEALNVNADHEKVTIPDASTTLEVRHNGIDVTLPFFRDLLSEKPVQGADAIHGLAGWSEGSAGGVGKGKKRANTTLGRGGRKNRILAASV